MAEEYIQELEQANHALAVRDERHYARLMEECEKNEALSKQVATLKRTLRKRQTDGETKKKQLENAQEELVRLKALNQMLLTKLANAERYAKMQDRQVERMSELSVALHGQAHAAHQRLEMYQAVIKLARVDPSVEQAFRQALEKFDASIE